jgi:hypothetical protein
VFRSEEREWRGCIDEKGDRRQLARCSPRGDDQAPKDIGGRRQQHGPAEDHANREQPELEAGHDAEVAAAAADRPEQVRMLGLVCDELATVGGHDLDREQRIDRQAVLAHQPTDPAAEGQARDAHRARVAERGGQAMGRDRLGELDRREAWLGPGDPRVGVDVQTAHVGEVEDEPAVDRAMAGHAVTPATHGELELVVTREEDGEGDVAGVGSPNNRKRPGVDGGLMDVAGGFVLVITRPDETAVDAARERLQVERLVEEGPARGCFQGQCSSWGERGGDRAPR